MATRYYPSSKSPGAIIHGPLNGTWALSDGTCPPYSPVRNVFELQRTKFPVAISSDDAIEQRVYPSNNQGDYDYAVDFIWMTPKLQAQTISGTFNFCLGTYAKWMDSGTATVGAVIRFKLHMYIAVGQSTTVRTVLINNFVDSSNLPFDFIWKQLSSDQTIPSSSIFEGDVIVIEFGARIVSFPVSTITYPPTDYAGFLIYSLRARDSFSDATPGATSTSLAPWLEFSASLLETALPARPANDTCATAIEISSLPYTSNFIDASTALETDPPAASSMRKSLWWTFVPAQEGLIFATTLGSNYDAAIYMRHGGGCGSLAGGIGFNSSTVARHRSQRFNTLEITGSNVGQRFWIEVYDGFCGLDNAMTRLSVFYRQAPAVDDLYIPNSNILALRNGQLVNMSGSYSSYGPTGVGIDYTERPMVDQSASTHTGKRIVIGSHNFDSLHIADLDTLGIETEVDYINDPTRKHPAQIQVTAAGMIHSGWFGDGYGYIGYPVSSINQHIEVLNAASTSPAVSALKSIDATHSDSQVGNPFTDVDTVLPLDGIAAWAFRLDEATGILYYVTGGEYIPVGGSQIIKRYNLTTSTPMSDFATIPASGINPGLKGLDLFAAGGLVVCNGNQVVRLDATGTQVQTYGPSSDVITLADVRLTIDQTKFWVVDLYTTRLWQFDVATGAELQSHQLYGYEAALTQMVIYGTSSGVPVPPPNPVPGMLKIVPNKRTDYNSTAIPNPTFKTGLIP